MNLNIKFYEQGLVKYLTNNAYGVLSPILFNWNKSNGVSLMNPSIFIEDDRILCNVRCVNYTLHHSEKNKIPHWGGPLQYIHPENDVRLATENYMCELSPDLTVNKLHHVNMLKLHNPLWEFHGLEDGRLVKWNNNLYLTGVRRDTTDNGQGRMELSTLDDNYDEIDRHRIPSPNESSYCEKNWMPVLDKPYTYVKWTNPTELVSVDLSSDSIKSVITSDTDSKYDIRGGSQVVRYKDYYIAIGHSVNLWKPYSGEKDSCYDHHLIIWDLDFNPIFISDKFKLMNFMIEFCCGLAIKDNNAYISFACMDNMAFIFKFELDVLINQLNL